MAAAGMPLTRTHEAVVCGVPTRFVLTRYTNRLFIVASQTDNMGTLVRGQHRPKEEADARGCHTRFRRPR